MAQNRFAVRVDLPERHDTNQVVPEEVLEIKVQNELTPLSLTGLILLCIGLVGILIAVVILLITAPWSPDITTDPAESLKNRQDGIYAIDLVGGFAALITLLGTSIYFFGRESRGVERFSEEHEVEVEEAPVEDDWSFEEGA